MIRRWGSWGTLQTVTAGCRALLKCICFVYTNSEWIIDSFFFGLLLRLCCFCLFLRHVVMVNHLSAALRVSLCLRNKRDHPKLHARRSSDPWVDRAPRRKNKNKNSGHVFLRYSCLCPKTRRRAITSINGRKQASSDRNLLLSNASVWISTCIMYHFLNCCVKGGYLC